jgi:hypothetical protein
MLSDNGNEFKGHFTKTVDTLKMRHTRIQAGRPQTNGSDEPRRVLAISVRALPLPPLHRPQVRARHLPRPPNKRQFLSYIFENVWLDKTASS